MKTLNYLIKSLFSISLFLSFSCSSDDSKPDSDPTDPIVEQQLVLSASETKIEDGEEINFTVKADAKTIMDSQLFINNESIKGANYTFDTPGTYNVVAKKEGFKDSDALEIVVTLYEPKYEVFMTGAYYFQKHELKGYYWHNGVPTQIDPNNQYSIEPTKISIDGDNVYLAGFRLDSNKKAIGTYWKNGARQEVHSPQGVLPNTINGIFSKNDNVYVAGNTERIDGIPYAFYWKNSIPVQLETPDTTVPYASDITVVGDDVYVVGSIAYTFSSGMNYTDIACYWKNGIRHEVEGTDVTTGYPSSASAIFVKGNDVYICGNAYAPNNFPAYWKNGQRIKLSDNGGLAQDIFVDEQDNVYAIGYLEYNNKPIYWKNGELFELPNTVNSFNSIQVINDDVFIGGITKVNNLYSYGYWKNQEFHSVFTDEKLYNIQETIVREIPRIKK